MCVHFGVVGVDAARRAACARLATMLRACHSSPADLLCAATETSRVRRSACKYIFNDEAYRLKFMDVRCRKMFVGRMRLWRCQNVRSAVFHLNAYTRPSVWACGRPSLSLVKPPLSKSNPSVPEKPARFKLTVKHDESESYATGLITCAACVRGVMMFAVLL